MSLGGRFLARELRLPSPALWPTVTAMSFSAQRRRTSAGVLALAAVAWAAPSSADGSKLVLRSAFESESRGVTVAPASPTPPAVFARPAVGRANGPALLHVLGPRWAQVFAPSGGLVGALAAVPPGATPEAYGLVPVAPGIGRLDGDASSLSAFALAHPEVRLEVAPPLRPLSERIVGRIRAQRARDLGADGRGTFVGVADTGLDVTHPDMLDASGKTRVAWMLDLSLDPLGVHPELEQKFGFRTSSGALKGAVLSRAEIDQLLSQVRKGSCVEAAATPCTPLDEVGHGTHVTGIAAGSGVAGGLGPGIAPSADLLFVRITRSARDGILNEDLVRAVQFMFDRADAEKKPAVVNLSLGSDFGPHDGTMLWEQTVASFVGPDKPGHAIIAAAGNSGSIVESPIHQSVRVSKGTRTRVPIRAVDRDPTDPGESAQVQVWVRFRRGADLKVGLASPQGTWIEPVEPGVEAGKNTDDYNAGVISGSTKSDIIPPNSPGAVVVWAGKWPAGTYDVLLEGEGMAELYLQGVGDAQPGGRRPTSFVNGVREGTVNLPATHPAIISVGATTNLPRWLSVTGAEVSLRLPLLDASGSLPAPLVYDPVSKTYSRPQRDLGEGEVCWFSSAGPTSAGVQKPEIAAPGAMVASSMSRKAKPGQPYSIFSTEGCPAAPSGRGDERCLQFDDTSGMALGTSMASPVVAGVVALLLEKDPTLTQAQILALLQGGARRFLQPALFDDQAGPGEVDAFGSLEALERMKAPKLVLPAKDQSWIALSSTYVPADGSTPMTVIVELRDATGEERADAFGDGRLAAYVAIDGTPVDPAPAVERRGPGVWVYTWTPPPGYGGSRATFGATFDGQPVVTPRTMAIATDGWTARYPNAAGGSGCAVATTPRGGAACAALLGLALVARGLRRRRHSSAMETSQPCGSHTSSSGSNG